MIGALKCKLFSSISFKSGSGFSAEQRKNPPKLGSIVTFKYQKLTKYGKPRFPIYMRER